MMLQKPSGEIGKLVGTFARYLHEQLLFLGFAFYSRIGDGYDVWCHGSLC